MMEKLLPSVTPYSLLDVSYISEESTNPKASGEHLEPCKVGESLNLILTPPISRWEGTWVVVHSVPHLRVYSILLQIVENGSSYPLYTFHNIFPHVVSFFIQK
jgi:hypothetical protein